MRSKRQAPHVGLRQGGPPDRETRPGDRSLDISILIATYRRPDSLEATLESVANCAFRADAFQVIVCDNAGDQETRGICDKSSGMISLEYVVELTPGKNNALNTGLELATGELLLFTDDDVRVDRGWLSSMWKAFNDYPCHNVFGGPVLPEWPAGFPAHLQESQYRGVCFSVVTQDTATGPEPNFSPFGTNMGVRRTVFDTGIRYNPDVGPTRSSYIMGSETSLVRTLARQGNVPVYVSDSSVIHRIRPEQASLRWLLGRGARYGRMLAYQSASDTRPADSPKRFPRWLILEMLTGVVIAGARLLAGDRGESFEAAFRVAIAWGKLRQHFSQAVFQKTGADGPEDGS